MYVAITCIMTCSISNGFVTYHGSLECEINYNYMPCNSDCSHFVMCGDYYTDISLNHISYSVKVMLTLVLCCLSCVTICRNLSKSHIVM